MCKEITIQLGENKANFIRIYEGGGNIDKEDIKAGYCDYANIDEMAYSEGELNIIDGGQLMLKEPFETAYPKTTWKELVADALEYIGYDRETVYTVIEMNL